MDEKEELLKNLVIYLRIGPARGETYLDKIYDLLPLFSEDAQQWIIEIMEILDYRMGALDNLPEMREIRFYWPE